MKSKRNWQSWPKNVRENLNGISGVTGLGGTIMSFGSLTFLSGGLALAFTGVGAVVAVSSFVYAAAKAFPPTLKHPQELINQYIRIDELDNIYPKVKKIAILGPTQVGKTTLEHRLAFEYTPNTRTQSASAKIVALSTTPITYAAVLDGAGEVLAQQFKITVPADFLCIIIDHNNSNRDQEISRERLNYINDFLTQVRHQLKEMNAQKKTHIEILINKRDLWQKNDQEHNKDFLRFCDNQYRKWEEANFADSVSMNAHSNEIADDVVRFVDTIKKHLS